MRDTEITQTNTWSDPVLIPKGNSVSVSVKGSFIGTIIARRWHSDYGPELPDDSVESVKHIGIIQRYFYPIETVDVSAGSYYYQIGTDRAFSGSAWVHIL